MIQIKKVYIFLLFAVSNFSGLANTLHETTLGAAQESCRKFKKRLDKMENVHYGYAKVPRRYSVSRAKGLKLFYWKRSGTNLSYPPLVFLHGGVGGNSSFLLDLAAMKELIAKYPGDFFAFDHRGEGCSKVLSANLHPSRYAHLRVQNVARDLEFLRRRNFFGQGKIRLFGQSRGSAIVHHYFSLYPHGVESAHAHGLSIESRRKGLDGVVTRATGYLRAWRNYLKKFPRDREIILKIKNAIPKSMCWEGRDRMKICGRQSVGVFGISLARVSSYQGIHNSFMSMLDSSGKPDINKIREVIGARWNVTVYSQYNYIIGTNTRDFAMVGLRAASLLKKSNDSRYFEAPFSEIRFSNEAIQKNYVNRFGSLVPLVKDDFKENYVVVNYQRIKHSLKYRRSQHYFLYQSVHDPIAPIEMYRDELMALRGVKNFHFNRLPNGHEDFEHPLVISRLLKKNY